MLATMVGWHWLALKQSPRKRNLGQKINDSKPEISGVYLLI